MYKHADYVCWIGITIYITVRITIQINYIITIVIYPVTNLFGYGPASPTGIGLPFIDFVVTVVVNPVANLFPWRMGLAQKLAVDTQDRPYATEGCAFPEISLIDPAVAVIVNPVANLFFRTGDARPIPEMALITADLLFTRKPVVGRAFLGP